MHFSTCLIITLIHGSRSLQSDLLVLLAEVIKAIAVGAAESGLETGKMTNTAQVPLVKKKNGAEVGQKL